MGRTTKYNKICAPEKMAQVNPKNIELGNEFIQYLKITGRAESTLYSYKSDLNIVWVYVLEKCGNKDFIKVKKRELIAFQGWLIDDHGNSPARVRRLKATVSSLSNFIQNVLAEDEEDDADEYKKFKPMIRSIESPVNEPVREKCVLSDEQCKLVLDTLCAKEKYEQACYFALAIYSGRRKSELLRFKTSYFDDSNLICGGCLYATPEKIKTKGRGKGKFIVCYTIARPFKPYFDLWMNQRRERGIESEWLFPNKMHPENPKDICSANAWANSISVILGENFYSHSCRHKFTTSLHEQGVPDSVIQSITNWNSLDMVRLYTDVDDTAEFEKYFTSDGIVAQESKSITDL